MMAGTIPKLSVPATCRSQVRDDMFAVTGHLLSRLTEVGESHVPGERLGE
jgi:hypothetical protein